MLRTYLNAALLLSGSVLFAGSPVKIDTPREAAKAAPLSITGIDPGDGRSEPVEGNVVVLPGALEYREELPGRAPRARALPFHPPPAEKHSLVPAALHLALPEPPAISSLNTALLRKSSPPRLIDKPPAPPVRLKPNLPGDFERDAALYLQRRLGVWREEDARRLLGTPARERSALDSDKQPDGRIVAFSDPSQHYREFELDFDGETGYLRTVFVYPWKMKWDDCRKVWGANVTSTQTANGRWFHSYENRRLDVLVDGSGTVISLGLY
jgi:hypothetical protein